LERGLVQIFTGDGKGKTSAALGTALRALGHRLRVYIAFFMKADYAFGERNILATLDNVKFESFGSREFVNPARIKPEDRERVERALAAVREAVFSGEYDLVIMDEINAAVTLGLVAIDEVVRLIEAKPPAVELILTGRNAAPKLVEIADLVTECLKIKHPFDEGIMARKGIEY
jgi:cob(I)alamin adenosyltransferase